MGQELRLDCHVGVFPLSDRFAEMGSIPVNDDGGEQVEPDHAAVCVKGATDDLLQSRRAMKAVALSLGSCACNR